MPVIGVWQRRVKLSSIVVAGDVSGAVSIVAPSVAGTTTLTLPSVSGTLVSTGNAVSFSSVTAPILNSATTLSLQTNGTTTAVTIDASQNTGMGAVSLGARLQTNCVQSSTISSPFTTQPISLQNTDTTLNNYTSICNINSAGAANAAINFINIGQSAYPNNAGAIAFSTYAGSGAGGTEKVRIDNSGNMLVAGTSFNANGSVCIGPIGTAANGCTAVSASASATNIWRFYNPNGNIGTISISGSTTTYATSSDYRLKENVLPMVGALETIAQLKPVTYDWISDKSQGQGFIAHELQAVIPDCVVGEKDAVDAEGNPQYQGIDTSFLVGTLTAAIQELKAIIDIQQTQITALNAKVGI